MFPGRQAKMLSAKFSVPGCGCSGSRRGAGTENQGVFVFHMGERYSIYMLA
ncbi:hypothetical protein AFE_0754 [Acidithiobacillus ferrooxidans ATCC 23270]|uniref:Uncharacterized protein n=1 Tax=Acidithiobacillus ferrooxidans (strain ATCC 23270 / DSM 14882 / CIP 104768 / NCIMB 8455) TaxID=243159 RepID=B7J650_ACIF2|nr:hypothetical protein AFE_0754 [Acidithiobacillus ferrooxidans ATCC 23270]